LFSPKCSDHCWDWTDRIGFRAERAKMRVPGGSLLMPVRSVLLAALLALLAGGCGEFPRDPNHTLSQVRQQRNFRVGLMGGEEGAGREAASLVARISRQTGASPQVVQGAAERLLTELENGQLEVVIGSFDKKTPWRARVTIGPPLAKSRRGAAEFELAPAMRNGENAWIALIEGQVRDLAPQAQ
jgi:hypothetical protein